MLKLIKALPFIITVFVMGTIFVFSSQSKAESSDLSESVTARIVDITPIIKDKPPQVKKQIVKNIHNSIRKCAHFLLYSVLGISSFLMFAVINNGKSDFRIWIFMLIFCIAYAISDEVHQGFIPGRSAEAGDVLLDLSGSMSGGIVFINLKDAVLRLSNYCKR